MVPRQNQRPDDTPWIHRELLDVPEAESTAAKVDDGITPQYAYAPRVRRWDG